MKLKKEWNNILNLKLLNLVLMLMSKIGESTENENSIDLSKYTEEEIAEHRKDVTAFFILEVSITAIIIFCFIMAIMFSNVKFNMIMVMIFLLTGLSIILINEYKRFYFKKGTIIITGIGIEIILIGVLILIIDIISNLYNQLEELVKLGAVLIIIILLIIIFGYGLVNEILKKQFTGKSN